MYLTVIIIDVKWFFTTLDFITENGYFFQFQT